MNTPATTKKSSGRRWISVLLAASMVGLMGVLLAQASAGAHDHQIPQTVLKKGAKELQAGTRVVESNWVYLSGDGGCANENAVYQWRFPETDRVAAGSELRVRIFKSQRPDSFEVATYPELDKEGAPGGEGRLLNKSLERVVRNGETVGWDAVFKVKRPDRDYYLVGEGHWEDREGCGGADQYAFWSFHVKTGSSL